MHGGVRFEGWVNGVFIAQDSEAGAVQGYNGRYRVLLLQQSCCAATNAKQH